jgi:hypothetical protein
MPAASDGSRPHLTRRRCFVFPLQPKGKQPLRGFSRWEERATRDPNAARSTS